MDEKKRIRIGIDVGGTFTDAVAVDADDFSIVCSVKTPTTHSAKEGVARGVVDSIQKILEEGNINPSEVVFIAHGTTQATNALLEGDVANVGIIGMGSGIEGVKAKTDTAVPDVEVSEGKFVKTVSDFIDTAESLSDEKILQSINRLKDKGAEVIVASEAFSVDNPENEQQVEKVARESGLLASGGHEISKLYGLRARTRTATINASILPKMVKTADMTQMAVNDAQIKTPLMIMRCDGGVMKIEEVKSRPILTILSGPAAGVAGALMYERVSDGIFLEVGGTSTDISAIRNGKVMVNYAEVGGHKTYVTSLDVRTIGIGGGSVIRVGSRAVSDVGPRSAHIANCGYCVYADPEVIRDGKLELISPLASDPSEYAVVVGSDGKRYAITLSCAANVAGFVKEGDYAKGNVESARYGLQKLADHLKKTVDQVVDDIMAIVNKRVSDVVIPLMKDYDLDRNIAVLAGGGGGASTVVWSAAKSLGMEAKLVKNAPVISTIGAALAMVRDVVERTMINPTEEDILRIRKEAEHKAIELGANPSTVEVNVEIDTTLNRVRAIAVGAMEMTRKNLSVKDMTQEEIEQILVQAYGVDEVTALTQITQNATFRIYEIETIKKARIKFLSKKTKSYCIIDKKGVIKLRASNANVIACTAGELIVSAEKLLKQHSTYDEAGEHAPDVFMLVRAKLVEFRGLPDNKQLATLINAEAVMVNEDEPVALIVKERN